MEIDLSLVRVANSLEMIERTVEDWKRQGLYVDWVHVRHGVTSTGVGELMVIAARQGQHVPVWNNEMFVVPAMTQASAASLGNKLTIPQWESTDGEPYHAK